MPTMGVTSLGRHTRPACHLGSPRDVLIKKVDVDLYGACFSWLLGCEGSGAIFMVCACAVGLCGNGLPGMRGTWGVVWRSAHVPTIPFTWLRRANAWTPSAHASNYQALFSIKLCKECGFNSCVRVFFIPWGHVSNHAQIWAFVTSISHMGQMRASDWSRKILLRSDWLLPRVAIYTTNVYRIKQNRSFLRT